jgi:hypothetical protein
MGMKVTAGRKVRTETGSKGNNINLSLTKHHAMKTYGGEEI